MAKLAKEKKNNTAIIGAGAAGLFAALILLKEGISVTLFERNDTAGKKLLLTGNGKCNYSNKALREDKYNADLPLHIKKLLTSMSPDEIKEFFYELGIPTLEKDGYFYPFSEQALSVKNVLEEEIINLGGTFCFNTCISSVKKEEDETFSLFIKEECVAKGFDSIILCCGGKAAPKTGSDGYGFRIARSLGHDVSNTYPVLVQLESDDALCKSCTGVRCRVTGKALVDGELLKTESGELQITDYGVSGIMIFNLSRAISKPVEEGKNCEISLDFLPEIEAAEAFVTNYFKNRSKCRAGIFFNGLLHKKLTDFRLKEIPFTQETVLTAEDMPVVIEELNRLKSYKIKITGHKGYENAQATKGGVVLSQINESLESELVKNVYFAGEMLDVDGDCGGYNLHWAWTSAKTAAEAIIKGA